MRKYSKYNLFLDDVRMPYDVYLYTKKDVYNELDWQVKRSYDEFVECIVQNGLPEVISFDHDLADEHYLKAMHDINKYDEEYGDVLEKTGYHCAVWLTEYCMDNNLPLPQYHVHSMNPSGYERTLGLLDNFKKHHKVI